MKLRIGQELLIRFKKFQKQFENSYLNFAPLDIILFTYLGLVYDIIFPRFFKFICEYLVTVVAFKNTAKPLYNEHHRDLESVRYRAVFPSQSFFPNSLILLQEFALGRPQNGARGLCWWKKEPKKIYQRISCLYDNLDATGWQVFAMRERTNQSGVVAVVRTYSHCKEEVGHVLQNSP